MDADLFEVAHVYLPGATAEALPSEQYTLGMISGVDFYQLKGVVETLLQRLGVDVALSVAAKGSAGFAAGGSAELKLAEQTLGYIGIIDPALVRQWKLLKPVVAAELSLPVLLDHSHLVPQQQLVSAFPSIQRDLNFIVAEKVRWSELENVVCCAVGSELAGVTYRETYRDAKKDGPDRKRVLLTVELQRHDATLSGEQADELIASVVGDCKKKLQAELLS